VSDNDKGLYRKFDVQRTDGKSEKGQKHYRCRYFVLDLDHDKYAIPALRAYAGACGVEFPELARDLFQVAATPKPGMIADVIMREEDGSGT